MLLDDAIRPVVWALRGQTARVGGEETVVVSQIEPLGVPPSMVRRQPHRDVLARPFRLLHLQHQVEASGPHGFPHAGGSSGGVEKFAPVEVEP